jgi:hypothetical protein
MVINSEKDLEAPVGESWQGLFYLAFRLQQQNDCMIR